MVKKKILYKTLPQTVELDLLCAVISPLGLEEAIRGKFRFEDPTSRFGVSIGRLERRARETFRTISQEFLELKKEEHSRATNWRSSPTVRGRVLSKFSFECLGPNIVVWNSDVPPKLLWQAIYGRLPTKNQLEFPNGDKACSMSLIAT
ncbi:hypothetical protein M9H77_07222 [Catharanthus roseus]|uniref:Uncharacterized protein n=1 Tax=Catharanthus roseus TaxID=4058 RepID=A0ACC0BUK1_CATRO|nr:hypothetical protein M9H77_07222 [Catharanthus roseus]